MPHLSREHHSLLERFTSALGPDSAVAPSLLLAVSGGSDSMALLELTALARGARAASDLVVYVDHRLREETHEEAAHVRSAAERLGLGFRRVELVVPRSDERSLRDARYAELEKTADTASSAFILTGHTRDDQIETVLHRLVRGAGRHGLSGIPQRRGRVLRPLLACGRDELRSFLRDRGVSWCEDRSNQDLRYLRNRLRHRVIPFFDAELGDGSLAHLPALAIAWAEEDAYLESEAARYAAFAMTGPATERQLDSRALGAAPAALRSRIVRAWLAERTGRPSTSFSRAESTAIVALAQSAGGTRRIIRDGFSVVSAYGVMSVVLDSEPPFRRDVAPFRFELETVGAACIDGPDGWVIESVSLAAGREDGDPPLRGLRRDRCDLETGRLSGPLVVRPWQPGDRVRFSPSGTKKVADLMIDARLPSAERARWPVVESNGEVVWVPGLASSADYRATGAAARRLRLSWRRDLA